MPIDRHPGSRLLLYPFDDVPVSPFNLSVALRESLDEHHLTRSRSPKPPEVEINDSPGDVVAFPGSAVWHVRRRRAGATNL